MGRLVIMFMVHKGVGIDREALGTVVGLGNVHASVGKLKHVAVQRNDNDVGVARALLNVVGHDRNILEVQCGVNFVHDEQWCRLEVMEGKDQRQRQQSFFAVGQVADILPLLIGRPDREMMP